MIDVDGLTRRFGDVAAVDHLSFQVQRGSICGFIGPNGAGKSTTMRILVTLERPDEGLVSVDGLDVVRDHHEVRRRVGYMPDDAGSCANLLVDEYLDFFARARGLAGARRRDALDRIITFTGLTPLVKRPMDALSKGERQRVSLGRALLGDPRLLVLDEPSAGLDPGARAELREVLLALAQTGVTIFISSHDLPALQEVVTSVVMIQRGRLSFAGTLEAMVRHVHGAERYLVEVHDPPQARRFFAAHPAVLEVTDASQGLLLHVGNRALVPRLVADAVGAGLELLQFYRPTQELEDAFVALTSKERP
jgi:ABC-2 type transport system ATP-binding protein